MRKLGLYCMYLWIPYQFEQGQEHGNERYEFNKKLVLRSKPGRG